MRYRIIAPLVGLSLILAACAPATPAATDGISVGDLRITGVWARAASLLSSAAGAMATPTGEAMAMSTPEPGSEMSSGMPMAGTNSAAYMVIRNTGGEADKLIKAESDVAGAVEIHNVKMENNVMEMFQVDGVAIPANGQAELKPGSFHVMLIGLNRDLKVGDKVKLTLTFEKAGTVSLEAEVRQP